MNVISRAIAFLVVSIGLSFLLLFFDNQKLSEINNTPPDAYIMNELGDLHQRGFFVDLIVVLLVGALYLGAVELIAYLLNKFFQRYFVSN